MTQQTPELQQFDIQETIGGMLASRDVTETNRLFASIVEHVDLADLQLAKRVALEAEHHALQEQEATLIEQFMEQPATSLMTEIGNLALLSGNRALRTDGYNGSLTEFVTRTENGAGIDTLYQIGRDKHDKVSGIRVLTKLRGQLDTPVHIHAAPHELNVYDRVYRRDDRHDFNHGLAPGEYGDTVLRASFGSTLWAAHLAVTRDPEAHAESDRAALGLLARYKRGDRSVL